MHFYLLFFFCESSSYPWTVYSSASFHQDYKQVSLRPALVLLLDTYQQEWTKQSKYPELNINDRMAYRYSLKSLFIFYFMRTYIFSSCIHVKHMFSWCLQKASKGMQFSRTGVKRWLWMPCGYWELDLGLLQEQHVPLTTSHCSRSCPWKFWTKVLEFTLKCNWVLW